MEKKSYLHIRANRKGKGRWENASKCLKNEIRKLKGTCLGGKKNK